MHGHLRMRPKQVACVRTYVRRHQRMFQIHTGWSGFASSPAKSGLTKDSMWRNSLLMHMSPQLLPMADCFRKSNATVQVHVSFYRLELCLPVLMTNTYEDLIKCICIVDLCCHTLFQHATGRTVASVAT